MGTALNVQAWSTTAASNNTADTGLPTIADSMAPTGLDDSLRGIMASLARYQKDTGGAVALVAGTADAIAITTNQAISSAHQAAGFSLRFRAGGTNTGATTVNVDAIGAASIKRLNGDALSAGDIVSGGIYDIAFDGTNYKLMGASAGAGTYGSLSGSNTWSGANVFTNSVTIGDGAADVVVIKGTTVNSFSSGLLSSATAAALGNSILGSSSAYRLLHFNGSGYWSDITLNLLFTGVYGGTKGSFIYHNGTQWTALAPP